MSLIEMLECVKEQLPEGETVNFDTPDHNKTFTALKNKDDITFITKEGKGTKVEVKWPEFHQVLILLLNHPEGVLAGDAQNKGKNLIGGDTCSIDTIEGQISHYVHGVPNGKKAKTRRATYIMPVLIKAELVTYDKPIFRLKNNVLTPN